MRLEYKVWNIHREWQPMRATTLEQADRELQRGMPYTEEAVIRNPDTGESWRWNPPRNQAFHEMFP